MIHSHKWAEEHIKINSYYHNNYLSCKVTPKTNYKHPKYTSRDVAKISNKQNFIHHRQKILVTKRKRVKWTQFSAGGKIKKSQVFKWLFFSTFHLLFTSLTS